MPSLWKRSRRLERSLECRLRKMMPEELERRNYSAGTTRRYLGFVEVFAEHFASRRTSSATISRNSGEHFEHPNSNQCTKTLRYLLESQQMLVIAGYDRLLPSNIGRVVCGSTMRLRGKNGVSGKPYRNLPERVALLKAFRMHYEVSGKLIIFDSRTDHSP